MTNSRRTVLLAILKLNDSLIVVSTFLVASLAVLRETRGVTAEQFFEMRVKVENLVVVCAFVVLWHLIFRICGLYTSKQPVRFKTECVRVITATTACTGLLLASALVGRIRLITSTFVVVFWLVSTMVAVLSRVSISVFILQLRKRARNLRRIVIVGTNSRALKFAQMLAARPEQGVQVAGFVDQPWSGLQTFLNCGFPLLCGFDNFGHYLRSNVVDLVVIAVPFRSMYQQASDVATACHEQGITASVLSSLLDLNASLTNRLNTHTEEDALREGNAIVLQCARWLNGVPFVLKRIIDIVIASLAIVTITPVFLIAATLVKLTSRGPILFRQERLGLNKRPFTVYKIRTMVSDAEQRLHTIEHLNQVNGAAFKVDNDPRVTPIGRLLRKTSIDELPQFFNVLRGDMSLVGPRPLPMRDYRGFREDWQRRRFSVKPGLTCLWQIHGRSAVSFTRWMELDLEYIERWSLGLDFKILLRTIPVVLKGTGAS